MKERKFGGWNLNYMTPLLINDLTTWTRHIFILHGNDTIPIISNYLYYNTFFKVESLVQKRKSIRTLRSVRACTEYTNLAIPSFNHSSVEKTATRQISSSDTKRNKSSSPSSSSSSSIKVKNVNYGTDRDTNVKRTVGNVVIS